MNGYLENIVRNDDIENNNNDDDDDKKIILKEENVWVITCENIFN